MYVYIVSIFYWKWQTRIWYSVSCGHYSSSAKMGLALNNPWRLTQPNQTKICCLNTQYIYIYIYIYIYMCVCVCVCGLFNKYRWILSKLLAIGRTIYNCTFFKEINCHGSFHVTATMSLLNIFFTRECVCISWTVFLTQVHCGKSVFGQVPILL